MSEEEYQAHAFVNWLLEEDGWGLMLTNEGWAYSEDQNEVWDWDGNNDK